MILWLAACTPPATLTDVQAEVFTPSCAFSTCHSAQSAESDLDLSEGAAYGALVGVASTDSPDDVRVVPGDPDGSYLVLKISGADGIEGDAMPQGSGPLDEERIARVRSWIDAGAKDD